MSQLTRAVLGSCGLMVGWNMAPPPPGPTTRKLPGRESAHTAAAKRSTVARTRKAMETIFLVTLFYLPLFALLFCQKHSTLSIPFRTFARKLVLTGLVWL